jgi:hypothetical protein
LTAKLWLICPVLLLSFLPSMVYGAELSVPELQFANDEILVSTALTLDEKSLTDLKNGVEKEFTFYLDIYRIWNVWPDEFITGKKIQKILMADPVKKEYVATSFDGMTRIKKRFRDFDSMLNWVLTVKGQEVVRLKELEPANYFVRVSAESRLRSLPPVIGYLLFFVPEKEFKVRTDSPHFPVGQAR